MGAKLMPKGIETKSISFTCLLEIHFKGFFKEVVLNSFLIMRYCTLIFVNALLLFLAKSPTHMSHLSPLKYLRDTNNGQKRNHFFDKQIVLTSK